MDKPTSKNTAVVRIRLDQYELYFRLYLHDMPLGSNHNQSGIVDPKLHDWPLYDGPCTEPNAKVIARAQSLVIQAGMRNWSSYNSFWIVFEDERFKGSTLQVMGPVVENGELAIVGGTGEFTLAQGIISKKIMESQRDGGDIVELDIRAFYSPVRPAGTLGNCNRWSLGV